MWVMYRRFEKGSRYYEIRLEQDMLRDWTITRVNGQIGSPLGQVRRETVEDQAAGVERLMALSQYRLKRRGYRLMAANNKKEGSKCLLLPYDPTQSSPSPSRDSDLEADGAIESRRTLKLSHEHRVAATTR